MLNLRDHHKSFVPFANVSTLSLLSLPMGYLPLVSDVYRLESGVFPRRTMKRVIHEINKCPWGALLAVGDSGGHYVDWKVPVTVTGAPAFVKGWSFKQWGSLFDVAHKETGLFFGSPIDIRTHEEWVRLPLTEQEQCLGFSLAVIPNKSPGYAHAWRTHNVALSRQYFGEYKVVGGKMIDA